MTDPQTTPVKPSGLLRKIFYKASAVVAAAGTVMGVVAPYFFLGPVDAGIVSGLVGGIGTCGVDALFYRTKFNSLSKAYDHYAVNGKDAKRAAFLMMIGAGVPLLGMHGIHLY